jgi:Flp pilus assembly pilin Flp
VTNNYDVAAVGGSSKSGRNSSFAFGLTSAAQLRRPRTRREVKQVQKLFAALQSREEGQTMAEYGVVLAVITIAVIGALGLLSNNIVGALNRVAGFIGVG